MDMVLSKGKIIILVVIFVIGAAVGGFFYIQSSNEAQYQADYMINQLFDYLGTGTFDLDDESAYPDYLEEFETVRDNRRFHRELVEIVDEFSQVGLHNYDFGRDDLTMIETRYGDRLYYGEVENLFSDVVGFLNEAGYEDEELRDSFIAFFVGVAQGARERTELEETSQENELEQGSYLDQVLQDAAAFSQAGGDFYQIPADQVATAEEIAQHYDQAIQLSHDAGDRATFAKALSAATSSPVLEGQTFLDSVEIVDFLMEDGGELYTLRNWAGGYYDTHEIDGNGQITYYGDFAQRVVRSGGGQYDMSEMTPEVWWSLSSGQREEISSGNQSRTSYYYYLLGENYDGNLNPTLGDDGYGYVYLNEDGSAVGFRSSSIIYVHPDNSLDSVIYGDFADLTAEVSEDYQENLPEENAPSTEWDALIEGTTPVTDEAYAPYTGTFAHMADGQKPITMYSEFRLREGQVCWATTQPFDLTAMGVTVHTFFSDLAPVTDMAVTETYDTVTATASFTDGAIRVLIQDGDTVIYDETYTKEG